MNQEVGNVAPGSVSAVEHRWSQRRSVSVPVEVFDHGNLVASCISRDIGLGGVFLISEVQPLQFDHDIDLFFCLGDENPTKHKLKAKLVRNNNQGAGFMFKDFDTNAFRALQEIMRFSSAQSQA